MADFPTYPDLFRIARDEVLTRNTRITRDAIEREGTDVNALTAAGATVADECIGQLTAVQAGLLLDSSRGVRLDKLVFDPRYGSLTRKPAAPARGRVQFRTTAPNPIAFDILAGTRLATIDGTEFYALETVNFPAGSTGPIPVYVQSQLAGLNQQARIGTITSIQDVPASSPADLVVTNDEATQGADDEENDDSLKDRARRFFATARRGTLGAIELGALAVAGVRRATAFEPLDGLGFASRIVELVVADAFTEQLVDSSPTPTNYQAQLSGLGIEIERALYDVRAGGIQVLTKFGVTVLLGITLSLSFRAGVNTDDVTRAVRSEVVNYVNGLNPGQPFLPLDCRKRIERVSGLVITGNELLSPLGPVVPKTLEMLRTYLALVLVSASGTAV